ncbi:Rossmann-like and DUF2520 domain-containing protein [Prauserella cavernicola]|uniref:DUF2520 domain-containing protein n=1 Tax=Prauserella cavernicola TaxID=2800127 RepID=A0A934QZK7_9PSEU|nr:Rossmann-like and DUF2520 domain-containing protein [Prauserella cavernicola]MBK1789140.1 DUF2520 domain-containing protein [Prauserella cavernicola]
MPDRDHSPVTSDVRPIGLIGTGRVGRALGTAFAAAGRTISRTWDVDAGSARSAADSLGAVAAPDLAALVSSSDTLVFAVPDDALAATVDAAAAVLTGRTVFAVHVCGRHGAGMLAPLAAAGLATAALHPVSAFVGDVATDVAALGRATFAVTGRPEGTRRARELVSGIGDRVLAVAEQDRALYHAALAHGSNLLVYLVHQATVALLRAGVPDPAPVLAPLLRTALENSIELGLGAATGPLVRGDVGTVGEHVAVLEQAAPELVPTYRALSGYALDAVDAVVERPADRRALQRILDGPEDRP